MGTTDQQTLERVNLNKGSVGTKKSCIMQQAPRISNADCDKMPDNMTPCTSRGLPGVAKISAKSFASDVVVHVN